MYELNIDGLVGPTHHYAGLSIGNIASLSNARHTANPAAAAHQGIQKMRLLHHMGLKQALLPPHQRPNLHLLHQLGFTGTPTTQLNQAMRRAPHILSACYSASSMWAANAATVSPSIDTDDKRVHFTPANLISNLHRQQEAAFSGQLLRQLFADPHHFHHHEKLPGATTTSDEGAANHTRLSQRHHDTGIHLFVYGKQAFPTSPPVALPTRFPARQTLEASQGIARRHLLRPEQVVFACQNPAVIDQGVFHNDVIAVGNESVLLLHEDAFLNQADVLAELDFKSPAPLQIIEVRRTEISVADAVHSYLFNSQLVTLPSTSTNKKMALIAPSECETHPAIKTFIDQLLTDDKNPITEAHFLDLKQSMKNGGGPACLRLRVPLTEAELSAMHQGILVNDTLLNDLDAWIDKHYRSELHFNDLADPLLIDECFAALDALTVMLGLGAIYPFQLNL